VRSAQGAEAGCAFFWLLFFAQAKKSDSLRSEAGAKAFDLAFNSGCSYVMFVGFGCSLTPTPLPQVGEGLEKDDL